MHTPLQYLKQNRFLFLLIALLAFFIIIPFTGQSAIETYLFGLMFSIVLVLSVYVIEFSGRLLFTGILLMIFALTTSWIDQLEVFSFVGVRVISEIITILFLLLITYEVLRYVAKDRIIKSSTLYGAVCGYLLIGLTWSFAYLLLFTLTPSAFSFSQGMHEHAAYRLQSQRFIYFSFVTLSTLGYGDILPVSSPAKMLCWLEAITGQIYLTVWIAQLVGLYIAGRFTRRKN